MVEAELGFFQVQFEGFGGDAIELGEPPFGVAPKRLDAVDVVLALGELVAAVVDPKVFVKADVDQAVVAPPAVRVDDCAEIDLALAFQDAENDGLAARAAPAFAPDPMRAEVSVSNIAHADCQHPSNDYERDYDDIQIE